MHRMVNNKNKKKKKGKRKGRRGWGGIDDVQKNAI